jgi:hypothetical protein
MVKENIEIIQNKIYYWVLEIFVLMKNAEKFKDHNLYDVLHRERQYKMHLKRVNNIYAKSRINNQQ